MAGKIIGSIMVISVCLFAGYRLSIREKLRLNELLYFKEALTRIMSELEHNRATFCNALEASVNIEDNEIFNSIHNAVKNNNSIKTGWKFAFEENADNSYMSREDIERLSTIGEGFGSGDIELQKKYVTNAVDYINSQEGIILQKFEKDKKVYRSVSFTLGLFIVLLLI